MVRLTGEAEVAPLYYNYKRKIPLQTSLMKLGYAQPKTPEIAASMTSEGLINNTMTPKCVKTYDQRFNWLKCREAQKQVDTLWKSGEENLVDFDSKKHPIRVIPK